jgi:excisionase family DNA binding protein
MGVVTLGEAARRTGVSKTTLTRMLARGEISGTKDGDVWNIEESEIARIIDARKKPRQGKRREMPVEAMAQPVAVELAVLRVQLEAVRKSLDEAVERAKAAEEREALALARERAAADRVAAVIEDKRTADEARAATERAAAERAAEDRARAERLLQAVEDMRKPRGFWARLTGR